MGNNGIIKEKTIRGILIGYCLAFYLYFDRSHEYLKIRNSQFIQLLSPPPRTSRALPKF